MFKIDGDTIEFEGERVGTIRDNLRSTQRAAVVDALESYDAEREEKLETLESDLQDLSDELDRVRSQRDAYAAILGVDPDVP